MSEQHTNIQVALASRRSCDQCRSRKVRCDKTDNATPCSSCRSAQRECSWKGASQAAREPRHRVLISHQYERKIDQFESRLEGIEALLQRMSLSLSELGETMKATNQTINTPVKSSLSPSFTSKSDSTYKEQQRQSAPAGNHITATSKQCHDSSLELETNFGEEDSNFRGNSSMAAHTVFASEFLEQAMTNVQLGRDLRPDINNALTALRKMAQEHGDRKSGRKPSSSPSWNGGAQFPHQKVIPRGGLHQLSLPPVDTVLEILREIRILPPMAFMMGCIFLSVDGFIDSCRRVFFATEDFGLATFMVVNAGLYYVFEEKLAAQENVISEPTEKEKVALLAQCKSVCRDNLETALAHLPLLLLPDPDLIDALLLGVTYAIENSWFTLAWQLNSSAAAMCQALGWHHVSSDGKQPVSDTFRPSSFWFCYMLDKGLSLRFGRTPLFQDWDISTPRRFRGNDEDLDPSWHAIVNTWIHTGSILSETFENLYSSSSLRQPIEKRMGTALRLVDKAERLWAEFCEQANALMSKNQTDDTDRGDGRLGSSLRHASTVERILKSGEVGHLATLTLIYRAVPRDSRDIDSSNATLSTFHPACIAAARGAFRSHHECMLLAANDHTAQSGHLHWTILYTPFTPFIVLFCHVIETASRRHRAAFEDPEDGNDLGRLAQFTDSLCGFQSPAIARMHRLCRLLYQVAMLYVQGKEKSELRAEQYKPPEPTQEPIMPVPGQSDPESVNSDGDLDMYLTQLGFLPAVANDGVTGHLAMDGVSDVNANHVMHDLDDWFTANTYVMGLVEDPFLDFDPMLEADK